MWHILLLQTAQPVDKTLSGDSTLLKICLGLQAPGILMFRIQNYTKKQGQRALCHLFIWVYGKSGRERKERTLLSKVSVPEAVPTCTSCPCTQECTPFLWVPLRQLTQQASLAVHFLLDGECLWQVTSVFLSIALLFSAAIPGPPDSRRPLHTETRRIWSPFVWSGIVLVGLW